MARKSNAQRAAEKAVKKTHPATLLLALLFLIIGAVAGVIVCKTLTKGDKFELNGEKQVVLLEGENFEDPGVTIISFGRDISAKVMRGGDIDKMGSVPEPGTYQIVYTVSDFRWGDYQLVRTVIVGGDAEVNGDGE